MYTLIDSHRQSWKEIVADIYGLELGHQSFNRKFEQLCLRQHQALRFLALVEEFEVVKQGLQARLFEHFGDRPCDGVSLHRYPHQAAHVDRRNWEPMQVVVFGAQLRECCHFVPPHGKLEKFVPVDVEIG